MNKFLGVAVFTCIAVGVGSCSKVREHTYPPDFQYLAKEDVHEAMWQLATHADAIDELMGEVTDVPSEEQRTEVLGHLEAMEKATATLTTEGVATNHPVVGANVHQFRRHLQAAQVAVKLDPPNYYLAGTIAGSCQYCHKTGRPPTPTDK